jgi:AraC-like DNA-binding protein
MIVPALIETSEIDVSGGKVGHAVFRPSVELRPFVKRFEFTHSYTERNHTLLPDTSLVACFRLDGVARLNGAAVLPHAILSGLQDRARVVNHHVGSRVLLAVFTEAGAAALVREPLDEIFNRTMAMDCLLRPERMSDLHGRLTEVGGQNGHSGQVNQIEILGRFLRERLDGQSSDPLTEAAASLIRRRHGAVRMEKLAKALGLSLSALERRFRRHVGASPRKFASIVRMRHALRLRSANLSLTEVAYRAGYCDQSHFIRDFKGFTGMAPESFFRRTATFC